MEMLSDGKETNLMEESVQTADCKELKHAFSTRGVLKFQGGWRHGLLSGEEKEGRTEEKEGKGEKQRQQIPLSTLADTGSMRGSKPATLICLTIAGQG